MFSIAEIILQIQKALQKVVKVSQYIQDLLPGMNIDCNLDIVS